MCSVCQVYGHLPGGLDASDAADVQDDPGTEQTQHQPPLQTSRVIDRRRAVQSLSVPEIIHRRTAHALRHQTCGETVH